MRIGGDCCGVWSAEFDIRIEALRLQDILAKLGIEGEGFGGIDGRIRLRGRGTSVDKLVGSADGQAALTVDGGAIDALIIEAIGLDIAESILVLLNSIGQTEEDKTPIRCAIVNLEFEGGVATTRPVLIDTVDSKITIDGQVNLRDETLDIFIESRPKDPSLFSANQPMHVDGPLLSRPSIRRPGGPRTRLWAGCWRSPGRCRSSTLAARRTAPAAASSLRPRKPPRRDRNDQPATPCSAALMPATSDAKRSAGSSAGMSA